MMTERAIDEILSKHPELPKEELIEKLDREKKRTHGLIVDETLLRMIAAELGVEIQTDAVQTFSLSIADLIPNLNSVTVTGRVVAVFQPKTFNGNHTGRLASFLIADESGILRVVLWNDKTDLIESGVIKTGQIVRVSHGHTKDAGEKVELHVGGRSAIETDPKDVEAECYPLISRFTTRISDVSSCCRNRRISVAGRVRKLVSVSDFERQDSSSGKIMRLVLADETGEVTIVAWNEKVDELQENLKKSNELLIVNAKVKKALAEGLELHVDAGTYTEAGSLGEEFSRIADLKESSNPVNVKGEVLAKPLLKDVKVKTSKQEIVKLVNLELKDDTGRIWVSLWRRHAIAASTLNAGDRLTIRGAYVKRGFGDNLELSTHDATSISVDCGHAVP